MIVLCALAAFASACSKPPEPVKPPRPVVVEAPQPLNGAGGMEVFPGSIHARTEADLSFRIPGKMASRKVDMGSRIKPGTVLATLDSQDAELSLQNARAAVAAAKADLALAEAEEKRYLDLKARGHVGQSAVDLRVNTRSLAQARLEQATSQLQLAHNQRRYTELTADAAGVVTRVMGEPGNVMAAGQPVVRYAADGEREVLITVSENRIDALRAAPQLAVELFNAPGKRYVGKVRDINPQADAATRTHEARVTVVGAGNELQLGATATVLMISAAPDKTFRLPGSALGRGEGDKPAVWTLRQAEGGAATVQPVPVTVLQYLDGAVIVNADLAPTDRLVTAGVNLLTPGMAVRPIDRAAKAAL